MFCSAGCQVLRPDPIVVSRAYNIAPELSALDQQPIEIGKPNRVLDTIGTVVGVPSKILLWNRRIDNHKISGETVEATADYMAANGLGHVKVRANQYAPHKDWKRLKANKTMHWLSRYTLGVLSLGGEAILPGRIVGGDHYNPFTQTVHLYSDVPAIAWHELAHAKDFSRRHQQASYALFYTAVPIWHETIASQDVMSYVADRGEREEIAEAIEILYPAYGTYAGAAAATFGGGLAIPVHYGTVIGAHANARQLAKKVRRGDDLGPLTSVASSSLMGQVPMATSFRNTPMQAFDTSSSLKMLSMKFSPKLNIRMPNGKFRELGRDWGVGLAASLDLDTTFDMPVTVSFTGHRSESQADWSTLSWSTPDINENYQQDFHDLLIGYRWDSNHESLKLHPMSDQVLVGLRYVRFADQIDERVTYILPSPTEFDSHVSATNNILAPSLSFQRRFRYGRWTAQGSVGAFSGVAGIDQRSESGASTGGQSTSQRRQLSLATGQNAELLIGSVWREHWSVHTGLRATNLTGVGTAIRDYANGEAAETTNVFGWGGFAGVSAKF